MHRHRGTGGTGALVLLGLTVGVATGFVAGTLFGAGGGRRVARMVRTATRNRRPPEARNLLVARIQAALDTDPLLSEARLDVISVGGKGVTVRGWLDTRGQRARAMRIAVSAAGGEPVVNRLLVRGEDDAPPALVLDDAPRSA